MESYYFALIAYTALSGGYYGMRCARLNLPNSTKIGMRKNLAGTPKSKVLFAELCATYSIHMIVMAVLVAFMFFVLKMDFAGKIGYVALTCAVGSFTGVSNGLLMGSFTKIKEVLQTVLFVAYSLLSAFLSGLMVVGMKNIIEHHAPIINKLNPATLIADSFYALTMFDTYERYFTNIITLAIIGVLSLAAAILLTRRKRYASL